MFEGGHSDSLNQQNCENDTQDYIARIDCAFVPANKGMRYRRTLIYLTNEFCMVVKSTGFIHTLVELYPLYTQ